MKRVLVLISLASFTLAGAACAQVTPNVQVVFGPAVKARFNQLGLAELEEQRQSLQSQVTGALEHGPAAGRIRSVSLVIQDIQPNRPTSAELGASAGLRATSYGTGDAAITGQVVMADGAIRPIRYRFSPPNLYDATNLDTWGDAQETFSNLASALGKGVAPYQTAYWPPPHRSTAPTGSLIAQ